MIVNNITYDDVLRTGPGTIAGRYLRSYWQPVYRSADIASGEAKPLQIMGEDFTLYRGETGMPHLLPDRCRHRGVKLSLGQVEGETLRCAYHGWRFDGDGRCVEQPAEPRPFCDKAGLRAYPTHEYLGLIFAYLGEGLPPDFDRVPDFENEKYLCVTATVTWPCNYFAQTENTFDFSHLTILHKQFGYNFVDGAEVEETTYGLKLLVAGLSGMGSSFDTMHLQMPNIQEYRTPPVPGSTTGFIARSWRVPRDDDSFSRFDIRLFPLPERDEASEGPKLKPSNETTPWTVTDLAQAIVRGEQQLPVVSRNPEIFCGNSALVFVQDCAVMSSLGPMSKRQQEDLLGHSDIGVSRIRQLWTRELRSFATGAPAKRWMRSDSLWDGVLA